MENFKTLLKWMIWEYHYFRKHPISGTAFGKVTLVLKTQLGPVLFFPKQRAGTEILESMILLHTVRVYADVAKDTFEGSVK